LRKSCSVAQCRETYVYTQTVNLRREKKKKKKGMHIKETLKRRLALVLDRNNSNATIHACVFVGGCISDAKETACNTSEYSCITVLIIFRWNVALAQIFVPRVPHTRCFSIIVVCVLRGCLYTSYRNVYIRRGQCILPMVPCHVTYNLMAFFPIIRSLRHKTHFFFLPFMSPT